MKYRVWMCGVGLTVCVLLWSCSCAEAQEMPVEQGGIHVQPPQSQPGPAQHAGQKHPVTGKKGSGVPRPERNRFEETMRDKSGGSRQRQSRRKDSSPRKRPPSAVSDEQSVSSVIGKRGKNRKKGRSRDVNVKAERIDDIPVLLAAMAKMGL